MPFLVLRAGEGPSPRPADGARIHLSRWRTSGAAIDSTVVRATPILVSLPNLPPALREVLLGMQPGERRRAWLPGRPGTGDTEGTVEIELLEVVAQRPPPATPATSAPRGATCDADGVCFVVVRRGRGDAVGPDALVLVEFTSWTADGRVVESTASRGEPMHMRAAGIQPVLGSMLQQMKRGERRLIYVPSVQPVGGAGAVVAVYQLDVLPDP